MMVKLIRLFPVSPQVNVLPGSVYSDTIKTLCTNYKSLSAFAAFAAFAALAAYFVDRKKLGEIESDKIKVIYCRRAATNVSRNAGYPSSALATE